MLRLHVLTLFVCSLFSLHAAGDTPAELQSRLRRDLDFLTSDACEGRGITTKGIDLGADYIEREFAKAGLKPGVKGSYFQPFRVSLGAKVGPKNSLALSGPLGQTIDLEHDKNYTLWLPGGNGKASALLVFAGYGITASEPAYDDYAGLDVAGRVVVIVRGYPRQGNPDADIFARAREDAISLDARLNNAKRRKAAGVLVVNNRDLARRFSDSLPKPSILPSDGDLLGLPTAFVKRDLVDALLGDTTLSAIEKQIDADLKPRSRPLTGWACRFETDVQYNQVAVKNIIGVLEGSGPLANETVVIGAHYDHVGYAGTTRKLGPTAVGFSGPGAPGGVGFPLAQLADYAIHHGADDNASGTSALLELARRFAADKGRQGRRLVFIAFSAEESGLLGAYHFCRHPTVPLKDITTMVNMDQVGRLQDDKLMVGGLGTAKDFSPLLDKVNARHGFKLTIDKSGEGPSDHLPFYKKGIPVFWFFTGFHEHYHRPTDVVGTLNVEGLGKIVGIVADVAGAVATLPSRPEWTKTAPFDRTKTLWSSAPSTGIVADYKDAKTGVLVADIIRNTPAARSGLKKGDRITALAGEPVKNARAFLERSRALKPGQKVALAIQRDGKPHKLEMQLVSISAGFVDWHFGFITNLADLKKGIVIGDLVAGGPAALAGLQKSDRIIAINGQPIQELRPYAVFLWSLKPGETVRMTIVRNSKQSQIDVRTAGEKTPAEKNSAPDREMQSSSDGAFSVAGY